MGHALRAESEIDFDDDPVARMGDRDTCPAGYVEVELELEEETEDEVDWCVDHGSAMEVLTTAALRDAIAKGRVKDDTKVWRDGHPCWQPVADFPELGDRRSWWGPRRSREEDRVTIPEQSGIRRIVPRARPRSRTHAFTSAFLTGLVVGALVYVPFATIGTGAARAQKGLVSTGPR